MKQIILLSFADQLTHWKGMMVILFIGAAIGALIGLLLRNFRSLGILFSAIVGMAGAWACQSFLNQYFTMGKSHLMNEMMAATAGSLILSLAINLALGSNKRKDRTAWRA